MKFLFYIIIITFIFVSCNSNDKFVGKWEIYAIIDSKNEVGGGKILRNSITENIFNEKKVDIEIYKSKQQKNFYLLAGFNDSYLPMELVDKNTLMLNVEEFSATIKITYNTKTKNIIFEYKNLNDEIILEYKKVSNKISSPQEFDISDFPYFNINANNEYKSSSILTLEDLQKLHLNPINTKHIETKGYKYLKTIREVGGNNKIFLGAENDTISIFHNIITWSANKNGKYIYESLKYELDNFCKAFYDNHIDSDDYEDEDFHEEYDEFTVFPLVYVDFDIYCSDDEGINYDAMIRYFDKKKSKLKEYIISIGVQGC